MKKTITLALLLIMAISNGCERDSSSPVGETPIPDPEPIEDAIVRANCLTVQAVVEKWAYLNDYVYPEDVDSDQAPSGYTVVGMLPNGVLLPNPYTFTPTEPVNGRARQPGETGYEPIIQNCVAVVYIITGVGQEHNNEIFRITNIDDPERKVKQNCYQVRQAAEHFAWANNDVYPTGIDSDTNLVGKTLLDILGGRYLENPYTGEASEPRLGEAYYPGQIGYEVSYNNDIIIACRVTGVGEEPGLIITHQRDTSIMAEKLVGNNCWQLKWAAESFARGNNGKYPKDIETDTNKYGHTLMDILNGYMVNPFTQASTEPRNRRAFNPGETGYEVIGEDRGYVVTGVGLIEGDIIYELSESHSLVDAVVLKNVALLEEAIEEFASLTGGVYPEDIYNDRTDDGLTVIDLLPQGSPLTNPVTGLISEPQGRRAAYPGEVGFEIDIGVYSEYYITGVGDRGAYIRIIEKNIYRD